MLADIDDTLTRDGVLDAPARDALVALRAAAVPVIAITGRPKGWSERFAREWPVAAIVAENGAVALIAEGNSVRIEYAQDVVTIAQNAERLARAAARVLREVPGATLARDSAGRITDIATDHAEFATLNDADIARVVAVMHDEGTHATVSSIHVNGWLGDHDKLSGARRMVHDLFGRDLDAERERWIYVGDSTSDQAMFAAFMLSVGVASLQPLAA